MADASQIREHMEVLGSDGGHVGVVDHVQGRRIKLTKQDPASGGVHHFAGHAAEIIGVAGAPARIYQVAGLPQRSLGT